MILFTGRNVLKLRDRLPVGLLLMTTFLVPQVAAGGELPVTLELTGAYLSASYSDDADWGFWDLGKYSSWLTLEEDESDLVELRLLIPGNGFTAFIAAERLPALSATGIYAADGLWHELSCELTTYDLAYGQWFRAERGSGVFAWVGLTRMEIEEIRTLFGDPVAEPLLPKDEAVSRLWGAAGGADGELWLNPRLAVTGRVVLRWAKGDRDQVMYVDGLEDSQVSEVRLSDTTSRLMYGGELGLRWSATEKIRIEGGWRYRDWRHDNGPASFSGAFLRLALDI
jgi:hypothetical protein